MTNAEAIAIKTWATLKPNTPFNALFPDGRVPVVSPIPMQPRDESAPFCYLLDSAILTEAQIEGLAALLYPQWQPECESPEAAVAYIREGLPIKTDWFSGFTSVDPKLMAALVDMGEFIEFVELEGEDEYEENL